MLFISDVMIFFNKADSGQVEHLDFELEICHFPKKEHHPNLLHSDGVLCVIVTIRSSACVAGKDEVLHPQTNTAQIVGLKSFISFLWIVDLLIHKEKRKPFQLTCRCPVLGPG